MAALTANSPKTYEVGDANSLPVKASTEIFLGAAVGLASGYARALVAGDIFGGFAEQHVNNVSPGLFGAPSTAGTDGALSILVKRSGRVAAAITSAAVTDINKAVYMSDDHTFTYTSTSNTLVGRVVKWISTGNVIVEFNITTQALS
jgi:hypothetical protein